MMRSTTVFEPLDLPVVDAVPRERCDAVRNRRRILAAADRLVSTHGPDAVSLDQIAAEAGVGKGTVFRRFGDKSNLLRSLVEEREVAFQEAFLHGPAPLGPSAPARERLLAFGPAVLAMQADVGEIVRASEASGRFGRFSGPYPTYRLHLTILLRDAAPDLDPDFMAEALLAPLTAELVLHQLKDRGMPLARLVDGWTALAERILAPSPSGC